MVPTGLQHNATCFDLRIAYCCAGGLSCVFDFGVRVEFGKKPTCLFMDGGECGALGDCRFVKGKQFAQLPTQICELGH